MAEWGTYPLRFGMTSDFHVLDHLSLTRPSCTKCHGMEQEYWQVWINNHVTLDSLTISPALYTVCWHHTNSQCWNPDKNVQEEEGGWEKTLHCIWLTSDTNACHKKIEL